MRPGRNEPSWASPKSRRGWLHSGESCGSGALSSPGRGEAQDGSFLPGLKAASVQSAVPFGPRAGQPLRRLLDPDLARAYAAAGWSDGSQRSAPPLVTNSQGFSLHAATRVAEGKQKHRRYVTRPAICLKRLEVRADGMLSLIHI